MDKTHLLDEITKIRRIIIEREGCFTLEECGKIAAVLEVDNVSLVAMLEAIRKDLFPQKFVLNLKDAERFQLLRTALQKNAEHVLLKKIAPELTVLAENFKRSQADGEACQTVINKLRAQIKPYTDKVPKLVKYVNEYVDLCEANFLNILKLKVLRINLRFLPLLKEANELFATCDNPSDKDAYCKIAERLYLNYPSLFKEEVYYFSIIRGILDAFYRQAGKEPVVLDIPVEISLLEEIKPEEVMVEEKTEVEEVAEQIVAEPEPIQPEVTLAEVEVKSSEVEVKPSEVEVESSEVEVEITKPEVLGVETEMQQSEPVAELVEPEVKTIEPEVGQTELKAEQPESAMKESESEIEVPEPETKLPDPETKQPEHDGKENTPDVQKKSPKLLYVIGSSVLLILIVICVYLVTRTKSEQPPVAPVIVTDTTTVTEDTVAIAPVVVPEKTSAPKAAEPKKEQPKAEQQPQAKPQPETKTPADKPEQQAEPAKVEKKAKANSLEAAREATQDGDYKKAFDIYQSLANAGNAEAQYCLGLMYETGKGVNIDIFEAVMWYRKAKAKGFTLAERKLLELGYN